MGRDSFIVGQYIHWQEAIFQITADHVEGQVQLEEWPIKAPRMVELAELHQAPADGSLLVGVAAERVPTESREKSRGDASQEAERLPRGMVITYRPFYNLEVFFTPDPPSTRERRLTTRSRQVHPDPLPKRGWKRQRYLSYRQQSNQSPPQKDHVSPRQASAEEGAEARDFTASESELDESSLKALRRALEGSETITIRWLNLLIISLFPESLIAPLWQARNAYPAAINLCDFHHHAFDLTADYQADAKPTWGMLLDTTSQMVIGCYRVFHSI